jgi:hypothetical protein
VVVSICSVSVTWWFCGCPFASVCLLLFIVIVTASLKARMSAEASRHLNKSTSCAYVVDPGENVAGSVALGVVFPGPF